MQLRDSNFWLRNLIIIFDQFLTKKWEILVLDVILGIDPVLKLFSLLLALLELKNLKLVKKFTKSDFQVSKLKVTIWSLSCAIGIPDGFKGISGELSYQQIGEVQGVPKMPSVENSSQTVIFACQLTVGSVYFQSPLNLFFFLL